jgi:hypothetical protein
LYRPSFSFNLQRFVLPSSSGRFQAILVPTGVILRIQIHKVHLQFQFLQCVHTPTPL